MVLQKVNDLGKSTARTREGSQIILHINFLRLSVLILLT